MNISTYRNLGGLGGLPRQQHLKCFQVMDNQLLVGHSEKVIGIKGERDDVSFGNVSVSSETLRMCVRYARKHTHTHTHACAYVGTYATFRSVPERLQKKHHSVHPCCQSPFLTVRSGTRILHRQHRPAHHATLVLPHNEEPQHQIDRLLCCVQS